jgi:ribosome-associated protein
MPNEEPRNIDFTNELVFKTSRSSGPGGQNVNKLNTKVELRLDIRNSAHLTDNEKELILNKLSNRINNEGILIIVSQSERTQLRNKENAIEKLYELIEEALTVQKERKKKKLSKTAKEKRLKEKKIVSERKNLRKDIDLND